MKVVVLFSGGKDSCLATWYALHQGWDVAALLTALPANSDSWMFHYPATQWTKLQAEAMEMPLHVFFPSNGKQEELQALKKELQRLKREGTEAIVSGAIASDYQKNELDMMCEELQLHSFAPLWRKDPKLLLNELLSLQFDVYVTGVSAMGLGSSWLGRRLDDESVRELLHLSERFHFNPVGEGGEYETFVTDAPFFMKKIQIERTAKKSRGDSHYLVIEEASLVPK